MLKHIRFYNGNIHRILFVYVNAFKHVLFILFIFYIIIMNSKSVYKIICNSSEIKFALKFSNTVRSNAMVHFIKFKTIKFEKFSSQMAC